jgi:hypothetical protein
MITARKYFLVWPALLIFTDRKASFVSIIHSIMLQAIDTVALIIMCCNWSISNKCRQSTCLALSHFPTFSLPHPSIMTSITHLFLSAPGSFTNPLAAPRSSSTLHCKPCLQRSHRPK